MAMRNPSTEAEKQRRADAAGKIAAQFVGVYWNRGRDRFAARNPDRGNHDHRRSIGLFDTAEEAAAAYAAAVAARASSRAWVPLTIRGEVAVVSLTQGKHAVVDVADWPKVVGRRWTAYQKRSGGWYAASSGIHLHRVILGVGSLVDHWDGDGLNNRRGNLREASPLTNQWNRAARRVSATGFKGVKSQRGRFIARIRILGKEKHLGSFATAEEAAHAYDVAARQHFGEFACTNFPRGRERPARRQT